MIRSARPSIPPVALINVTWNCFVLSDFEKWGRTDVQTDYMYAITGRPSGSIVLEVSDSFSTYQFSFRGISFNGRKIALFLRIAARHRKFW